MRAPVWCFFSWTLSHSILLLDVASCLLPSVQLGGTSAVALVPAAARRLSRPSSRIRVSSERAACRPWTALPARPPLLAAPPLFRPLPYTIPFFPLSKLTTAMASLRASCVLLSTPHMEQTWLSLSIHCLPWCRLKYPQRNTTLPALFVPPNASFQPRFAAWLFSRCVLDPPSIATIQLRQAGYPEYPPFARSRPMLPNTQRRFP
eukprot:EG_transcript_27140